MVDAVVLSKCQVIENCLERIHEEYQGLRENLFDDIRRQDSIILNLERTCQAAIDLGLRIIRLKKWGVPNESKEVFEILQKKNFISGPLFESLQKMVGFRKVSAHDYQAINLNIVEAILTKKLDDLKAFVKISLQSP